MWYFSWILGLGFALAFGILNAMWYEFGERRDDLAKGNATEG
jgi:cyd operon protein YbgT